MNRNNLTPLSPRDTAQQQYGTARVNLLLMIVLSAVNLILLVTGSETMLLFSATVPYVALLVSMLASAEVIGWSIALACLAVYLICWIFSKKHYGWMIAALVFFALDTAYMMYFYLSAGEFSGLLDMAIHAYVLWYLVVGVIQGRKLKNLPEKSEVPVSDSSEKEQDTLADTAALYPVDPTIKARVFLQVQANGHLVQYRRVKSYNELVIDNAVYAYVDMLMETPHVLQARLDGHLYEAEYDAVSRVHIRVDGIELAKKFRLV